MVWRHGTSSRPSPLGACDSFLIRSKRNGYTDLLSLQPVIASLSSKNRPYPSFLPVMGAGGINGELRDHSEHVDAIIRTHFNVANGHTSSFSASSSQSQSNQRSSTNSFNFPEDAAEEMACFSCSSNFTLFKRKVWAQLNHFIALLEDFSCFSFACEKILSSSPNRTGFYILQWLRVLFFLQHIKSPKLYLFRRY